MLGGNGTGDNEEPGVPQEDGGSRAKKLKRARDSGTLNGSEEKISEDLKDDPFLPSISISSPPTTALAAEIDSRQNDQLLQTLVLENIVPNADYDGKLRILDHKTQALIYEEILQPGETEPRAGLQKGSPKAEPQTRTRKWADPKRMGADGVRQILSAMEEPFGYVHCKNLQAALDFIKLAGPQADKLRFSKDEAPFKGAETEIFKALEAALGKHIPQDQRHARFH